MTTPSNNPCSALPPQSLSPVALWSPSCVRSLESALHAVTLKDPDSGIPSPAESSISEGTVTGPSFVDSTMPEAVSDAVAHADGDKDDVTRNRNNIQPNVVDSNKGNRDTTTTSSNPLRDARSTIFRLTVRTGQLAMLFLDGDDGSTTRTTTTTTTTTATPGYEASATLARAMGALLSDLWDLSVQLSIPLHTACQRKIVLNCRKYPVELSKGKSSKYTEYSQATGITRTVGQSTLAQDPASNDNNSNRADPNDATLTTQRVFVDRYLPDLIRQTRAFAVDREWEQYHTPRNLVLALTGELGELAELFQFLGDDMQEKDMRDILTQVKLDKVAQEIADVTIYLMRLSDVCGVALSDHAWEARA